jgi:hypothetical protein
MDAMFAASEEARVASARGEVVALHMRGPNWAVIPAAQGISALPHRRGVPFHLRLVSRRVRRRGGCIVN